MKYGRILILKNRHFKLIIIITILFSFTGCGTTGLHRAIELGDTELAKKIISDGENLQKEDKNKSTALHNGAIKGHIDVVRYLIKNNADINIFTTDLRSPLHYSMLDKDHKEMAILLLESGAELDSERTCMDDTRYIYSGKDVFAAARIYKLAGESYFTKGMHDKAISSYKASALLFNRSSVKFADLSKQQKSKEERAKFINILSGIGYIGAVGTGTSSTWAFENTDKYKNMSEVYHDTSILCEKYSVQCTSIVGCYEKYSVGNELENCVSKLQAKNVKIKK